MTDYERKAAILDRRSRRFTLAAYVGAAAWVVSATVHTLNSFSIQSGTLGFLAFVPFAVFVIALGIQFALRTTDEFTHALWYGAASFAFLVTVAWMVLGVQLEHAIYMATADEFGQGGVRIYAQFVAFQLSPTAFYASFLYRLWKGR